MNLNIGCGSDSYGDVRLDKTKKWFGRLCFPNILADAEHLPFRDQAFSIVKASHVLEHLRNPLQALKEIERVCQDTIVLKFPTEKDVYPSILGNLFVFNFRGLHHHVKTRKYREHLWIINRTLVKKKLEKCGFSVRIYSHFLSVADFYSMRARARNTTFLKRIGTVTDYVVLARRCVAHAQ